MSLASYVAAEEQHWAKQTDRHRAAIMAVHMLEMMGRAWSGRGWCDRELHTVTHISVSTILLALSELQTAGFCPKNPF